MNGISKIELTLENCEVITIDGKYIGDFNVLNIRTDIRRLAANCISRTKSCDSFTMEVYRDANVVNFPFGFEDRHGTKIFDRIMTYSDITGVTVYYDDSEDDDGNTIEMECDHFYVNYKEEVEDQLGSPNVYQSTYINDFGDLYIVIDKESKVLDVFDEDEINNEHYLDFKFHMYDIKECNRNNFGDNVCQI